MSAHDRTRLPLETTRIARNNLKDVVAARIRELIFSGELRPGNKVDQDALAEQLGVSRFPVREALIALEREALVMNVVRRGAFVANLTREDVQDHFRIYGAISAIAAERAARHLTDDDFRFLRSTMEHMNESKSSSEQEELNYHFHRTINRACGSARVLSVLRVLSDTIPARFFETGWEAVAQSQHERIFRALESRDGRLAAQEVAEHLNTSGEYAVHYLERRGFWDSRDNDASAK